jgi:type VI secretion system secreted protein Hcp
LWAISELRKGTSPRHYRRNIRGNDDGKACSTGKHYPEARLVVRKAGGDSTVEYLVITLKEVMVTSYQADATETADVLTEIIGLNFAKVEVGYQPQKADGGKDGGAVKYGWNIRENIKV